VWIGLAVSGLAVLACLALIVLRRRRPSGADDNLVNTPIATSPMSFPVVSPSFGATVTAAIGAGVVTAVVSRWWIGLVVAVATFVAPRLTRGRLLLAAGSPIALAFGALFDIPELGWVAIGLLIGDLVAGALWARHHSSD
jgi:hypothetical protein